MHDPGDEHSAPDECMLDVNAEVRRARSRIATEMFRLAAFGVALVANGEADRGRALIEEAARIGACLLIEP